MKEFLKKHNACREGLSWATENCKSMPEVWDNCPRGDWIVWLATRPGVLDDTILRRFACFCARQNWHLLTDERSKNAVLVAERFCDGLATGKELKAASASAAAAAAAMAAAWEAAWEAAWASASASAAAAAREAARAAALEAASDAAWEAASAAALEAAWEAAWASASASASAAAWDAQARWLRANAKPDFDI